MQIAPLKVIRWRLKEVMARHDIKNKDLAAAMGISENAASNLRKPNMPRLGGNELDKLCEALNSLSKYEQELITPAVLIEYIPEKQIKEAAK